MQTSSEWWIWIKLQIGVHCVKLQNTEHNKSMENTCTYNYYRKHRLDSCLKNWFHFFFHKTCVNFELSATMSRHSHTTFTAKFVPIEFDINADNFSTREQIASHTNTHAWSFVILNNNNNNKNTLKNSASTIDLEPYVKQLYAETNHYRHPL